MRSDAAIACWVCAVLLAGCGTTAVRPASGSVHHSRAASPTATAASSAPAASTYTNPDQDGPPAASEIPANVASIPDAVPRVEPLSDLGNPDSYEVYGDEYVILKDGHGYRERGYASWYGKKFQGKRTSSGEAYDMFKMTAAHKTLPIPCYARVTNINSGQSVIVRINDRGPFHSGRIIDLSYTAAVKLGVLGRGSMPVEVAWIDPSMPTPATQYAGAVAPKAQAPLPAVVPRPPPAPVLAVTPPPAVAPAVTVASDATHVSTATAPPAVAVVVALPPPARTNVATVAASGPSVAPTPSPLPVAATAAAAGAAGGAAGFNAAPPAPAVIAATPLSSAKRFLQAGLFSDPINAVTMRDQLNGMGILNVLLKNDIRNGNAISRVLIGPFLDDVALAAVRKRLSEVQMPVIPVLE